MTAITAARTGATAFAQWAGQGTRGLILRLAVVVLGTPLVLVAVLPRNPPVGIFLNGIVVGSLYSLLAIGLILIYRSNRIISFAQAELGAIPAVAGLLMYQRWKINYLLAVAIVVFGALALGALVEFVFIRRFRNSPRLILTVATIGLAQVLAFFDFSLPRWINIRVSSANLGETVARILGTPFTRYGTDLGGVRFTLDHLIAVVAVALLALGLGIFLRRSVIGLAARGAAENNERALLLGVPVGRVTTIVWMIAALFSAAGVFFRSQLVFTPVGGLIGPTVLLPGLAAAVIARMQSMPIAFIAGLALGVVDQSVFYSQRSGAIATTVQLPIILVALLLQRNRLSRAEAVGASAWEAVQKFRPVPRELRRLPEVLALTLGSRVALVALLLTLPFMVDSFRHALITIGVVYAIVGISLVILTGWAGQISLGQFAFLAVGAASAGSLASRFDAHFFVVLPLAGLAGAAMAVIVGIPALRIQGLYLAVTTLAFAAATSSFLLNSTYFGWFLPEDSAEITRPVVYGRFDFAGELSFYYLCLFILALTMIAARGLRASQAGRVLIAARDNERAAQSHGINLSSLRLVAFAVSGFVAAIAGALFVYLQRSLNPTRFTPTDSLEVFAMAVIGGIGSIPGAVVGAAYVVGFRYFLPDYSLLATGAGMLFLLLFFPGGLAEVGYRLRDAFLRWVAIRNGVRVTSLVADDRAEETQASDTALFETVGDGDGRLTASPDRWLVCPVCADQVPIDEATRHGHFVGVDVVDTSALPSANGHEKPLIKGKRR